MSWKKFAAATVVPPSLASAPDQTNPMDRLPRKVLIGTMSMEGYAGILGCF